MEVEFTLTKKQYWKLYMLLFFHTNGFFICITIFLAFFIFSLLVGGPAIYFACGYLVLTIVLYIITVFIMQFIEKNKGSFLKTLLSFGDENFIVKTAITEKMYKWNALKRWEYVGGFYLIFLSMINCLFVPESDIKEDEIPAFEHMLETKIGVPKWRIWSWKLRGALFLTILLSLAWLSVAVMFFLAPEQMDKTIIGIISGGTLILLALFVTEFYFILRGKKSGNKTMTTISSVMLLLTMVLVILLLTLSFVPFS